MHLTDEGQEEIESGDSQAQAIRFFSMLVTAGADSQSLWL